MQETSEVVKMFLKKIIKHFLTTFTNCAHSSERHTVEIFRLFGVFLELLRNLRGVSDGSKNLKGPSDFGQCLRGCTSSQQEKLQGCKSFYSMAHS